MLNDAWKICRSILDWVGECLAFIFFILVLGAMTFPFGLLWLCSRICG